MNEQNSGGGRIVPAAVLPLGLVGGVRTGLVQGMADPANERLATAEDFNFQIVKPLAVNDDPGVSLVEGTLHLRGDSGVSRLDCFD
jgi:hypothetical protein